MWYLNALRSLEEYPLFLFHCVVFQSDLRTLQWEMGEESFLSYLPSFLPSFYYLAGLLDLLLGSSSKLK